jgi:uncharacterized integral membrane protein (TIGR00698 family)
MMKPAKNVESSRHVQAADLYNDLYGDFEFGRSIRLRKLQALYPGAFVTILSFLAASYLADRYGAPPTLIALLIGLSLNFLHSDSRFVPGLKFASGPLLRVGIVLLGAKLTLSQFADLGAGAFLAIVAIAVTVLMSTTWICRMLGLGAAFGVVAGSAIAICGASAALAVSAILGGKRIEQIQLTIVLIIVSALSAVAMIKYPILAHELALTDRQAGFLMGTAIHDVAQALGAGYSFSTEAGQTSAIVKMTRVALLAPVLALLSILFRTTAASPSTISATPWFIFGFFSLAMISSTGIMPPDALDAIGAVSSPLLLIGITASAIRSPLSVAELQGWRPFMGILAGTTIAFLCALAAALLFI